MNADVDLKQLTPSQKRAFDFIIKYNKSNLAFPTFQEIADGLEIAKGTVQDRITDLVNKNYIIKNNGKIRFSEAILQEIKGKIKWKIVLFFIEVILKLLLN